MYLDVVDLKAFYSDRLGVIARRLIGLRIRRLWPTVTGDRILGVGYATPYLGQLGDDAVCRIAMMPAAQGVIGWPSAGPNAAALVLDDALPLPGSAMDRVLAVHSLEAADSPIEVLREIWRVLAPGGRLIAVVPNRVGVWSRVERTPFGTGYPFSRTQMTMLLREAMFSPIAWTHALAMPPLRSGVLLRTGTSWERIGTRIWPRLSGVLIVEATKLLHQRIPASRRASRERRLQPALAPPAGMRRAQED
ncbi:MAG: methyltransferase domain-containing protein [Bauldia sp.]|nr:methyltransferase domain-containing protein [Bauldia sp.]